MPIELWLPCVRFNVRFRPGKFGEPTDLEAAVLYFLDAKAGASLDDLCEFSGLGDALLGDLVIDMLNRRWIQVNGRGLLTVSEQISEKISKGQGLAGIGSTDVGKKFTLCFDLISGQIGYIPKERLRSGQGGDNTVPPVRKPGDADPSYLMDIESYDPRRSREEVNSWSARIFRALQTHAKPRKELADLDLNNCSIQLEPPKRPLDIIRDVRYYAAEFDVLGDRNGPIENLTLDYVGRETTAAVRRFARAAAPFLPEIAQSHQNQSEKTSPFATYIKSSGRAAVETGRIPSDAFNLFVDELESDDDVPNWDSLRDGWSDFRQRIEQVLASRIDLAESEFVQGDQFLARSIPLIKTAKSEIIAVAPRLHKDSPAISSDRDGFLETLAVKSDNGVSFKLQLFVSPPPKGQADRAMDQVANRLGDRCIKADPDADFLVTPMLAVDGQTLVFLDGSPLDLNMPGALFLRAKGSQTGEVSPIMGALYASRRIGRWAAAAITSTPMPGEPPVIGQVFAALSEVEDAVARLDGEDGVERSRLVRTIEKQVSWLWKWAQQDSESCELVSESDLHAAASRLLAGESQYLVAAFHGVEDERSIDQLPRKIRARLEQLQRRNFSGQRTAVSLRNAESAEDSRLAVAGREIDDDLTSFHGPTLVRVAKQSKISFILADRTLLIAADGLLPRREGAGSRRGTSPFGLVLHGAELVKIGLDFIKAHHPDLVSHLPGPSDEIWHKRHLRPETGITLSGFSLEGGDGNCGAWNAWSQIIAEIDGATPGKDQETILRALQALGQNQSDKGGLRSRELHGMQKGFVLSAAVQGEIPAVNRARWKSLSDEVRPQMAAEYRTARRLLPAAALADFLPATDELRDPRTRHLAACLARRLSVPYDLKGLLDAPLNETQGQFVAILLLEGLGANLVSDCNDNSDWLKDLSPALRQLIVKTAVLLSKPSLGSIAIPAFVASISDEDIKIAMSNIANTVLAERERGNLGKSKSVRALHKDIFDDDTAFLSQMQALSNQRDKLSWHVFVDWLSDLITGKTSDLGVDLVQRAVEPTEARKAENKKVDEGSEYWQRKNEAMFATAGHDLVNLDYSGKSGGPTLREVRNVFTIILQQIVPYLIQQRNPALAQVAKAAAAWRNGVKAGTSSLSLGGDLLDQRIASTSALDACVDPPWLLPSVTDNDILAARWEKIYDGWLKAEFEPGTDFSAVLDWYTRGDSPKENSIPQSLIGTKDMIFMMNDLLERVTRSDFAPAQTPRLMGLLYRVIAPIRDKRIKDLEKLQVLDDVLPRDLWQQIEDLRVQASLVVDPTVDKQDQDDSLILELHDLLDKIEKTEASTLAFFKRQIAQIAHDLPDERDALGLDDHGAILPRRSPLTYSLSSLRTLQIFQKYGGRIRSVDFSFNKDLARKVLESLNTGVRFPAGLDPEANALLSLLKRDSGNSASSAVAEADLAASLIRFLGACNPTDCVAETRKEQDGWHIILTHADLAAFTLKFGVSQVELIVPAAAGSGRLQPIGKPGATVIVLGRRADSPDLPTGALCLDSRQIALAAPIANRSLRRLFIVSGFAEQSKLGLPVRMAAWWNSLPADEMARSAFLGRIVGHMEPNATWGIPERLAAWGLIMERHLEGAGSKLSTGRVWGLCQSCCKELGEARLTDLDTLSPGPGALRIIHRHVDRQVQRFTGLRERI